MVDLYTLIQTTDIQTDGLLMHTQTDIQTYKLMVYLSLIHTQTYRLTATNLEANIDTQTDTNTHRQTHRHTD